MILFQYHYLSIKVWKIGNAFARLDRIELSPESAHEWRNLTSDIHYQTQKGNGS